MSDPTRGQLVQFDRNITELKAKIDSNGLQNLIQRFDVVELIARIDQPKLEAIRCLVGSSELLVVSEPTRSWCEQDGVIYFNITSNGRTGLEWERFCDENKYQLSPEARFLLRSDDFKPTSCVTTEIAVLEGILFEDNDRITKKIHAEANKRKLEKLNAEAACLIREKFSDKEIEAMGLWWIIVMHKPIEGSGGSPYLLGAHRHGGHWLDAYYDEPDDGWLRDFGFAFAVSQVST
mgnify:CR=1 FL=1